MFIHVHLRPVFCFLGALAMQNPMPDDLRSSIEGLIRESGAASVGVAVRDLQSGRELFLNPDETFHAASTMKVPGMMELMDRLAQGKAVSRNASREMVSILEKQKHRDGIPAGLPPDVRVANKTGSFTGASHDAAIVYPKGKKPYVLVVLSRGIQDDK